jgi:hypothetical protein
MQEFFEAASHAREAPMPHEKTIAQSRDRKGADPLADARGSVRAIFETVSHAPAHPSRMKRFGHRDHRVHRAKDLSL